MKPGIQPPQGAPGAADDVTRASERPADPQRRRALGGLAGLTTVPASWAASTPSTGAGPSPLVLRVDLERSAGATRPALAGNNLPWVHEGEALIDPQGRWRAPLLDLARRLAPSVLRYPGTPDTYHWRQGIGPIEQRPAVRASPEHAPERIVLGTQEFLALCDELGAEPLIELNLHEGSDESLAAEAADWLRHVQARRGPRVRWWELGNEPYLMEPQRPAASGSGPATEANPLFLSPAQYTRRVNRVMAALRAVDPAIRPGLPFATDTWSGQPWTPANAEVAAVTGAQLGYARTLLDGLARPQDLGFLALHYYMPLLNDVRDKQGRRLPVPDDDALYWAAMAGAASVRGHLDVVRRTWREHPRTRALPQPPLFITEFNAFFTQRQEGAREAPANAYIATQAGAMFVADLLCVFARAPDVHAAMQWSLSRNWHFGAITFDESATRFHGRPVYEVMRRFRRLLGPPGSVLRPVSVAVDTTAQAARGLGFVSPAPGLPLATALASQHGRRLQLLVIHKDPRQARETELRLDGLGPAALTALTAVPTVQAELATSPGRTAFHAPGQPDAVRHQALAVRREHDASGPVLRWTQPPASLAWIELTLPGPG